MTVWRFKSRLVLVVVAMVGSGVGCGESVLFSDASGVGGTRAGAAGGATNTGGAGATGGASNTGGAGAGGGAGGGCRGDMECDVDAVCVEGYCDDGGMCALKPLPAGTECGMEAVCDGVGNCYAPLGASCQSAGECANGWCVDGVCCDAACDGECEACDVPTSEGSCLPFEMGTDPDNECEGACDGAGMCLGGVHVYSGSYGADGDQVVRDVVVDSAGNVIVIGDFEQTIDMGGGALLSNGSRDVFIAKYDAGGSFLWASGYGAASSQYGWEVAVDAADNIIVAGMFGGILDFGAGPMASAGNLDGYIAKLDPNGVPLWSGSFGAAGSDQIRSLAVAPNGDIAVGGFFKNAVDFGGGSLASAGDNDGFVAVYNNAGAFVWAQRYGDGGDQRVYGVSYAADNTLAITGRHFGTINLGGNSLTAAGDRDVFVALVTANGTHVWSKGFGDGAVQLGWDVARDSSGATIIVGFAAGAVDFGGGTLVSGGGQDLFVAKFDAQGNHVFSKLVGDAAEQQARSVAVDASDNIFIAGYAAGAVDFGAGALVSNGVADALLAKYDSDGNYLWAYLFGGSGQDLAYTVEVDAAGAAYVVGAHSSTIDFGGGP
ncbi:MAG TPA: hypothetical protein ENK23_02710, partial [Sorangium sp.]|nr:hypothetical protein [Sorangium sp.]